MYNKVIYLVDSATHLWNNWRMVDCGIPSMKTWLKIGKNFIKIKEQDLVIVQNILGNAWKWEIHNITNLCSYHDPQATNGKWYRGLKTAHLQSLPMGTLQKL